MLNRYLMGLLTLLQSVLNADPLQHGKYYNERMNINIADYYVSEKLDGYRGYWDGKNLKSKTGYRYHPPLWFVEKLGDEPLDGELWMGRGTFDVLGSILNSVDQEDGWKRVSYMIFDMPAVQKPFKERVKFMTDYITDLNLPHVKVIPQVKLNNKEELQRLLDDIVQKGGEGLMFHHQNAEYGSGRVNHLLKVKPYEEGKGIVVGYKAGKGKYQGKVGSLIVKVNDALTINVGSGLTDELRAHPPALGTTIAFIYNGLTKNGKPRFARFKRMRNSEIE